MKVSGCGVVGFEEFGDRNSDGFLEGVAELLDGGIGCEDCTAGNYGG